MSNIKIMTGVTPDKKNIVSVIAKVQYNVDKNGQCHLISVQSELNEELEYYDNIKYKGRIQPSLLKKDLDVYPFKDKTDLVVQGTIRTQKPQKNLEIKLSCKGTKFHFDHVVSVTGNRFIDKSFSNPIISEPEIFTEIPMRYDNAYGGTDERAESLNTDLKELELIRSVVGEEEDKEISEYSYPRNPSGKGYLVAPEGLIGTSLPNLEFPKERLNIDNMILPLNKWHLRPYPACFDWFPHAWFPRVAFFGDYPDTHDDRTPQKEFELGILDENFAKIPLIERPKYGFSQGAHPFLWRFRLDGNELITINKMAKDGNDFIVCLPNHIPKIKLSISSKMFKKLKPVLDYVFIETEKNQISLLWRASLIFKKKILTNDILQNCSYKIKW